LLCNLLTQHPQVYASSTSHVASAMASLTAAHSASQEIKSELILDQGATHERLRRAIRGYVAGWYHQIEKPFIVDKSRAWNLQVDFLRWVFPDARALVCVRDLRSVFSSCERRNSDTAVFSIADNLGQRGLYQRADTMLSPEGTIGSALRGVEDLIRRYGRIEPSPVLFVKYEEFVRDPGPEMRKIQTFLEVDRHEHDFENVQNEARDVDALYLGKYPHDGSGPVECRPDVWREWLSPDVEKLIIDTFPLYNEYFRYAL
jgi:sulfotransferase